METLTNEVVEQQQYLTFLMAGEEYAINILQVKEIIEYNVVTTVPKCPKWIRGVINLRGGVVPIVDLAVKFGLDPRPVLKTTCIVILELNLENEQTQMGVIADAVSHVIEISADEMSGVPSFGTQTRPDYLLGLANLGKKFAMILDMDRVIASQELLEMVQWQNGADATEPSDALVNGADGDTAIDADAMGGPAMS